MPSPASTNGTATKRDTPTSAPGPNRCAYGVLAARVNAREQCDRQGTIRHDFTFHDTLPGTDRPAPVAAGTLLCARCNASPTRIAAVQAAIQDGRLPRQLVILQE